MSQTKSLLLGVTVAIVAGCSSGGGGGGSGPGPGAGSNGTMHLSHTAVTFEPSYHGGTRPTAGLTGWVDGVSQDVFVVIAYTSLAIEDAKFELQGGNSGELRLTGRDRCDLAPGVYDDTVTISVCLDSKCDRHVGGSPRVVPVRYNNTGGLLTEAEQYEFEGVAGRNQPTGLDQQVTSCGAGWTATVDAPWAGVEPASGTTSTMVSIHANSNSLPPGEHSALVTFTDVRTGREQAVPLNYTLAAPSFTATAPQPLAFFGETRQDIGSLPLTLMLDTDGSPYPWQVASAPDWLQVTPETGTLHADFLAPDSIQLSTDPAGLDGGDYSGQLVLQALINGGAVDTNVPVSLALAPAHLEVERAAVALTEVPGTSHLSAEVNIFHSRQAQLDWTATVEYEGDANGWLTVPTNGQTGQALALQANTDGLVDGEIYYATIRLSATDTSLGGSAEEIIKVGLYLDRAIEPAAVANVEVPAPGHTHLLADPLRPYVYYTEGSDKVYAVNVYTGVREFSIEGMGTDLRAMAISHDGAFLYVLDHGLLRIGRADLGTLAPLSALSPEGFDTCNDCRNDYAMSQIAYTRVSGRAALITGVGQIIDAQTGALTRVDDHSASTSFPRDWTIGVSGNGRVALARSAGSYEGDIWRYLLSYNPTSQTLHGRLTHSLPSTGYHLTPDLDWQGHLAVTGCSYTDRRADVYSAYDSLRKEFVSEAGKNGRGKLMSDGALLCAQDTYPDQPDLWVIDPEDNQITFERNLPSDIRLSSIAVSGDERRFIARSINGDEIYLITR